MTAADLAGRVLDCAAGASGFAAAANLSGGRVTAVDPAYGTDRVNLLSLASASAARGGAIVTDNEDRFVWTWYGSRGGRDKLRGDALAAFTVQRGANEMLTVKRARTTHRRNAARGLVLGNGHLPVLVKERV